jgi:thymidylate synthase
VHTINARNVEEAWNMFRVLAASANAEYLWNEVSPRGMRTREFISPVTTAYSHPHENILLDPVRDANPFFHLFESLWILNGRRDVVTLRPFLGSLEKFSDDGITYHGAYGYRMRVAYGIDQFSSVLRMLSHDLDSRRAVIQIWSVEKDLEFNSKDIPCNDMVMLKVRNGALNMTVCNRSNDAVWGCYGANAVQFAVLLEYLASKLGVDVGYLRQVSDSYHYYLDGASADVWKRCAAEPVRLMQDYSLESRDLFHMPMDAGHLEFDNAVGQYLNWASGITAAFPDFGNRWFEKVVYPMGLAHIKYREGDMEAALHTLGAAISDSLYLGRREAWLVAGMDWMARRNSAQMRKEEKQNVA